MSSAVGYTYKDYVHEWNLCGGRARCYLPSVGWHYKYGGLLRLHEFLSLLGQLKALEAQELDNPDDEYEAAWEIAFLRIKLLLHKKEDA